MDDEVRVRDVHEVHVVDGNRRSVLEDEKFETGADGVDAHASISWYPTVHWFR